MAADWSTRSPNPLRSLEPGARWFEARDPDDSRSLAVLDTLSADRRRGCAALLDRRRILRAEVIGLDGGLGQAQSELEDCLRAEWLACVQGDVLDSSLRRRSERACAAVDGLARELVFVRTALGDIDADLATLLGADPDARASA